MVMNTVYAEFDATLTPFLDLSRRLADLSGIDEIVSTLSAFLADTIPHDHLDLVFLLADDDEYGVVFETGKATDWANSLMHPIRLRETPIRSVIDGSVEYLLVGDAMNDPRFCEPGIDRTPLIQGQLRSRINLPILAGIRVLGALNISLSSPDRYGRVELDYARNLLDLVTPFLLSVFRETEYRYSANLSVAQVTADRAASNDGIQKEDIATRMPGVVYRFLASGEDMTMDYVSPKALEMFGLDPDPKDFVERFVAHVVPEERNQFVASIFEVVQAGIPWYFQGHFRKPDGEEISFVGMSQPSEVPEGLLYHGILLDTSEQKRKEETFRRLSLAIDAIEHGVAILDADDRYFYFNRRYQAFGNSAQGTLKVGRHFEDHVRELVDLGVVPVPEDQREIWIEKRMERHRSLPSSIMVEQDDGEWLLVREERLPDGGVAMIVTDVSELRQAQDQLKEALVQAESASKTKSEFLATMSHEFRTPLNAILGFSEIMSDELLGAIENPSYAAYIKDIYNSGRHMLDLVNDVLDFSALEVGKREFRPEPVDVAAAIARCLRDVKPAASEKRIKISTHTDDDLPTIVTDPRALRQCLINTLANAVKYTEKYGRIDVVGDINGGKLRIVVRDNGAGIAADRLKHVTEPFAQADNDPLRAQEGTGLGLSIVKSLLEGQGGKLEIHSELGEGTTVTMFLPNAV
jgi:signal transduction histidine kinase